MEYDEQVARLLVAKFMAKIAARPIKGRYNVATLGSRTREGGEVVSTSSRMEIGGHRVACVGDVVRYPDGTESRIVSGAGAALSHQGRPAALVGSVLDNGDTIVSSRQSSMQIREYADGDGIPGLLLAGYSASPDEFA